MLRHGGASPLAMREGKIECDVCQENTPSQPAKQATLPKDSAPLSRVAMDVKWIRGWENREHRIRALDLLGSKMTKQDLPGKDTFSKVVGLPKKVPGTVKELGDSFVSFRNELVHGVYSRKRPAEEDVEKIGVLLDILIATLEPILALPVVVRRKDGYDQACGPAIGSIRNEDLVADNPISEEMEDLPILIEGKRRLSLFPWVTIADMNIALLQAEGVEDEEE